MSLPQFEYRSPKTLAEAIDLRREYGDDALVMAGGLATVILLRERLVRPRVVVSLADLAALGRIEANGVLTIGATATHHAIATSPAVRATAPLIAEACSRVGSPAIRNMGTLGGSVCHGDAASDPAPALLALDAEAVIAGPSGERRVPLDQFFVGTLTTALEADEILTALRIPHCDARAATRFVKYTATSAEAFSTVTVAIRATLDAAGVCIDARIGLGSVGPTPMRAVDAEKALTGRKLGADVIAGAADAAMAATEPSTGSQGSAEYRREMTGVWVRRLLADIAGITVAFEPPGQRSGAAPILRR